VRYRLLQTAQNVQFVALDVDFDKEGQAVACGTLTSAVIRISSTGTRDRRKRAANDGGVQ